MLIGEIVLDSWPNFLKSRIYFPSAFNSFAERKKNKDTQFKLREKGKGGCGAKIYNGNKGRFNKFVEAWNLLEK